MKVLFVCFANIGRSQVAEEYFKQLTKNYYGFITTSAGVGAGYIMAKDGGTRVDESQYHRSIQYIGEKFHIDISGKIRQQLIEDYCKAADHIIMICEKDLWPDYLNKYLDYIHHWDIPDTPGETKDTTWAIWDDVCKHVEEFIKEFVL